MFFPPGGELDPRANPTIENGMLYGQNFEELRQGWLERGELFTDNGKLGIFSFGAQMEQLHTVQELIYSEVQMFFGVPKGWERVGAFSVLV